MNFACFFFLSMSIIVNYLMPNRVYTYISEHKDQNDIKKTSKCEITFYFKSSSKILSRKNKDIKVNYIIPKYKAQ